MDRGQHAAGRRKDQFSCYAVCVLFILAIRYDSMAYAGYDSCCRHRAGQERDTCAQALNNGEAGSTRRLSLFPASCPPRSSQALSSPRGEGRRGGPLPGETNREPGAEDSHLAPWFRCKLVVTQLGAAAGRRTGLTGPFTFPPYYSAAIICQGNLVSKQHYRQRGL